MRREEEDEGGSWPPMLKKKITVHGNFVSFSFLTFKAMTGKN